MNINQWKQKGEIYLWRYVGNPINYAGWHLSCNKEGCESFLELLGCFVGSSENAKRTVNISAPKNNQLKVPNCNGKFRSPPKLFISYDSKNNEAWDFSEETEKVALSVGKMYLEKIKSGVSDVSQGKGDYSIGEKGKELWFWWSLNG